MIVSVGNQSGAVKRRLVDMGLTPGTVVKVTKIAPLGDPLEVSLRGYELSLRKEDAGQIQIGPVQARPQAASRSGAPDPERDRRQLRDHVHELEHHEKPYDHNAHDTRTMKVALAGNPNCGKTTLFNALTGSNQYVGNWPGVTVEKKEGTARLGDRSITVVDLPGIYSLSPYSMEEIVARDFIIGEGPDAVIDIVDATNLERNLYLTVQLLELERPLVLALNFMDEVKARGDQIDVERLSKELGVPVVPITAKTGEGLDELLQVAHRQMHLGVTYEPDDLYDDFTHDIHHRMGELIHDYAYAANLPAHWASIKLLEGDGIVAKALNLPADVQNKLDAIIAEYEASSALGDRETLVADSRYRYIERVVRASVVKGKGSEGPTLTEKIDRIVTGKYTALPLFLCAMLVMFVITFGPFGSWLQDGVSTLIDLFSGWLEGTLTAAGAPAVVISLACDGIISGVGGVLSFLPQIALLFFFLSFLEDSGYMSRAAFNTRSSAAAALRPLWQSLYPMLMGFGCSVPAIMGGPHHGEREGPAHDHPPHPLHVLLRQAAGVRLLSARLLRPLGLAWWCSGCTSSAWRWGILSGILFKHTLFSGEPAPFVLELPPYRFPSMENIATHVWQKV